MTLDRVISRYGIASRTVAKEAILAGRLRVNGRVIRDPDFWVTPGTDTIQLDGKRLKRERQRRSRLKRRDGLVRGLPW